MFGLRLLPRTLEAALRDSASADVAVRRGALGDLVRSARAEDGERARQALLAALDDADADVRARAAVGLADADVRSAVSALLLRLEDEPEVRVRQMLLLALGELAEERDTAAVAAVRAALTAEQASERFQALLALHQLGPGDVDAAVIHAATDTDVEVQRLAFRIAEARFSKRSLPEALRARALAALDGSNPALQVGAALLLAEFGDSAGDAIVLRLIAERLAFVGQEEIQAAIEIAGRRRLEAALPALRRRARSWFGRDGLAYEARIALARLGDAGARQQLLQGLSAFSFDARTLAVAAAGRAGLQEARSRIEAFVGKPELADENAVIEALRALDAEGPETSP